MTENQQTIKLKAPRIGELLVILLNIYNEKIKLVFNEIPEYLNKDYQIKRLRSKFQTFTPSAKGASFSNSSHCTSHKRVTRKTPNAQTASAPLRLKPTTHIVLDYFRCISIMFLDSVRIIF